VECRKSDFHELPLHDVKIGVSCAKIACGVTGPIVCDRTVNAVRYMNKTPRPFFFAQNNRRQNVWGFQQDSATRHTADVNFESLR
jgi:hypothetical protein